MKGERDMLISNEYSYLLHLLSCAVNGQTPCNIPSELDPRKLFLFAERHGVSALTFPAISKTDINDRELFSKWKERHDRAYYCAVCQMNARNELISAFENNKIGFIEAQGTVVRNYYPNPNDRTMSDIDFIVDENRLTDVEEILVSLGYEICYPHVGEINAHRLPNINIEIHTRFFRNENRFYDALTLSFESSVIDDTTLFLYTVLHAIKHIEIGGCGIRRVLDIYLLNNKLENIDRNEVNSVLKNCRAKREADNLIALCQVWFAGKEHTSDTYKLEKFILSGGSNGTLKNRLDVSFSRDNRKFKKTRYVFSRLFPPLDKMKKRFPVLQKWSVLLPFFWIWRIIITPRKTISGEYMSVTKAETDNVL